jgi:hypothetical protein
MDCRVKPGNDDLKLHGELVMRGLDPRIHLLRKKSLDEADRLRIHPRIKSADAGEATIIEQ